MAPIAQLTRHLRRSRLLAALLVVPLLAFTLWRWWPADPTLAPYAVMRWVFRDDDDWFGLITAAVRCGDTVFFADLQQKIRAVDLAHQTSLKVLRLDAPPLGLAADCERQILYVVEPRSINTTAGTVQALKWPSGALLRQYTLPPRTSAGGAQFIPPDRLYMNSVVFPNGGTSAVREGTSESFYSNARIGLELSLTTGAVATVLAPYEQQCIGSGACFDVYLSTSSAGWIVGQPTSTHIGLYDASRRLTRTIDITSSAFQRTGEILALRTASEPRVRWMTENSTIGGVFQFDRYVATAHVRPNLPQDWVLGQPVNFSVFMNLHTRDGTLIARTPARTGTTVRRCVHTRAASHGECVMKCWSA